MLVQSLGKLLNVIRNIDRKIYLKFVTFPSFFTIPKKNHFNIMKKKIGKIHMNLKKSTNSLETKKNKSLNFLFRITFLLGDIHPHGIYILKASL